jgi:hypothetical protein
MPNPREIELARHQMLIDINSKVQVILNELLELKEKVDVLEKRQDEKKSSKRTARADK